MASGWRFWTRLQTRTQASSIRNLFSRRASSSSSSWQKKYRKLGFGAAAAVGGVATGYCFLLLSAEELELHPPQYPWNHKGIIDALDHSSIRRGYQVYREVCAACHSMKFLYFRYLIDACHTEDEVKAIAAEYEIEDLDDDGNTVMRPRETFDRLPDPYPNKKAAQAANNGAEPPDLSFMVMAREGNEDYVFSYLMGFQDPPAGIEVTEGQYYNVYFAGQGTSMAPALFDDMLSYEDGTPATASQMAKDVVTFLKWSAEGGQHDSRKHIGLRVLPLMLACTLGLFFWKRRIWSTLTYRRLHVYRPTKPYKG